MCGEVPQPLGFRTFGGSRDGESFEKGRTGAQNKIFGGAMKVNPEIFRGYDLRGLVGSELTSELALHLGRAYGTYLKRRGIRKLVVGRDSRLSGTEYSAALMRGLVETGADVVDIGMTMIGVFYWSQYYLKREGGVYVSASHNPPEYNGYKFACGFSETLVSDGMGELRRMVAEEDYEYGEGGRAAAEDVTAAYIADVRKRVALARPLRVLIDGSNTIGGKLAPKLLREMGCKVFERHCAVDPSFPLGVADPTSSAVARRLASEVVAAGADVGFTYDADGDRIGIADEKGNVVWNDVLLSLFALDVLRDHPGATIMYNILCSKGVVDTVVKAGGKPFMWRVGHSFLKKKNQEVKAAFIGELSGHFFFSRDFYNHDDGLFSTVRLLRYLAAADMTLSEAVMMLPRYVSSPEIKVFCADNAKAGLVKKISGELRHYDSSAEIIDDERAGDGVRLEMADAMLVVRYSQNGPYLTVKYEAKTPARYEELKRYLYGVLRRYPEIDWESKINLNIEALS